MAKRLVPEPRRDKRDDPRDSSLGRVVEKDGLDHAGQDLGHVDAHDLRDHLREVDAGLQGLGLDEEIVGELVELPHDLRVGRRGERFKGRVTRVSEGDAHNEQRADKGRGNK